MTTDYSKTVHLPRTNFPMKGDLPKREPALQEFWEKERVYEKMLRSDRDGEYVLHDGPPYANGHIHIGHALNKVLKDMVVKSHALMGKRSPYLPGWDCHGLPIETALLKEMKMGKRDVKDIPAFRKKAQEFAEKFIDIQRGEFRRLGILGEWDKPYVTMSPKYEAGIIRAFHRLVADGHIYRDLKPVYWCVYCETALAEAEIEYKEKASPSIYVAFPIIAARPSEVVGAEVVIWTTTPWTLPANRAVAFKPDFEYVLVEATRKDWPKARRFVLAKARMEKVAADIGATFKTIGSYRGDELAPHPENGGRASFRYQRPFLSQDFSGSLLTLPSPLSREGQTPRVFRSGEGVGVLADYVTAEDGTGVVHTAPGHGEDDFHTGKKYGLEILTPIDSSGRFTQEAPQFTGRRIFEEGNPAIIEDLRNRGWLLAEGKLQHSYPHCWRCKNPIVFRATEQWFLSIQNLRAKLLDAIKTVRWVPADGQNRIASMVENRPDWCISRQRVWGTPITVLFCDGCGKPSSSWPKDRLDAFMNALEKRVASEGTNFWFEQPGKPVTARPPADISAEKIGALKSAHHGDPLLPYPEHPEGALYWEFARPLTCDCGGAFFRRETDILDVWVDSGSSWLSAMEGRRSELYLEGSDQHRGWFMSSLVISTALTGQAPYRTVLTHGFVLDDKGRAMHKSLGNVVSPQDVIAKFGADVLRLWVALADYSDDVRLSDALLKGPEEAYRKIRNTLRYLLGNLYDFDPGEDAVRFDQLAEMDRYILRRLEEVGRDAVHAYEEFRFRDAARSLTDFCNLELSKFYLDACKDKLYTVAHDAPECRSAQTAMYLILRSLTTLIAPILSFTAEETWAEIRRMLREEAKSSQALPESVFLASFPSLNRAELAWSDELDQRWRSVLEIRQRVNKALEEKRDAGALGKSLDARVRLKGGKSELIEGYKARWPEILNVSQVEIVPNGGELTVEVSKAEGAKCVRCWRYQTDVNADGLCSRCVSQLRT